MTPLRVSQIQINILTDFFIWATGFEGQGSKRQKKRTKRIKTGVFLACPETRE